MLQGIIWHICTQGFIQALALPALFTVLGAIITLIAIVSSSWYAPLKWVSWTLLGVTYLFVTLLIMASRKADRHGTQGSSQAAVISITAGDPNAVPAIIINIPGSSDHSCCQVLKQK